MNDQHPVARARQRQHRCPIKRREAPKIEDAGFDAILGQAIGDAERDVDVRAVRHEREVRACAAERGPSDRNRMWRLVR